VTTRAEQPERGTALPSGSSLLRAIPATRSRSGRHRQPEQHPTPYRDVFAIREFRGLWSAQALSHAGDQVAQVAIAVLVYAKTGSAFLTAVAYALTYLPLIAGGPLLSGLADLFPRHRVMITLDLIRAGLVAVMALPRMPFAGLCTLLFGTVLLSPPFSAARSALLPDVLPPDKFVVGTAIGNITFQISQIAGFVLGAGAVAMLGPNSALALDVLSFCLSATIIAHCVKPRPAPPRTTEAQPSLLAAARDGTALVFGNPVLRTLMFFGWLAGFAVVPEGLAAPYAHALGGGPLAVGLLMAAMPAGTIVGTFAIGHLTRPSDRMRPMGWLAMLSCAPLVVSLLHPPFWLVLALWGLAGAGGAYQLAAAAAFVQALSASDRARAFGIAQSGLLAAQGLGILAGGALAQGLGPQAAVALAGLLGLVLAAVLATGWTRQHGEMIMTLSGAPRTPEAGTPEAHVPEAPAAAPQATGPQAHVSPLPRPPLAKVPAPEMRLPPAERWRPRRIRRGPNRGVSRRSWPSRAAVRGGWLARRRRSQ
jgi:MFS family permease